MDITVVGAGYVGLVTGVCLSEIGHKVICLDIDEEKIGKMQSGTSPIFEPGLSELMGKNIANQRLFFTTDKKDAYLHSDVIFIAVGTPENEDGSANLQYVVSVSKDIANHATKDLLVVIKSTVPVGTNDDIKKIISANLVNQVDIKTASNPEFLREGSAIKDSFNGDRIVVGVDCEEAYEILKAIHEPFNTPIYRTDIRSSELIKYASNAFLATKISFINEISNICELLNANIEDVSKGMGMDRRIGTQFLKAGIGYGGSCFPKDTKALVQIAGDVEYDFQLLKGVINVNKKQHGLLIDKLTGIYPTLKEKRIAVLGLAFKPNTDDMREAPSITIINELVRLGAEVIAYDPVAAEKAKSMLDPIVQYGSTIEETLSNTDAALILTEWDEIKNMDLHLFHEMLAPLVIDGRNCFSLEVMKNQAIEYHSVGRPPVKRVIERAPV